MGDPTFYNIQPEKTIPEWEAKCHALRQLAPDGPASRVSATLIASHRHNLRYTQTTIQMTPDQAREYARSLIEAADEAEEFDKERDKGQGND